MGEKKKKEATTQKWKKIVVVGACVLFVVLMIVSGMGSSWISSFKTAKPGDVVVIDYTIYNAAGNPIVTTDKQVYDQAVAKGKGVLGSKQITVVSNQTIDRAVFPLTVYPSNGGGAIQFALFNPEYNAISAGINGMKPNEQKQISISLDTPMKQTWSAEQLLRNKIDIKDLHIGDTLSMGVSNNPEEMISNTSSLTYTRIGEIVSKSDDAVVVDFSYPVVDVRVSSINNR
jgi:hypothetical protein